MKKLAKKYLGLLFLVGLITNFLIYEVVHTLLGVGQEGLFAFILTFVVLWLISTPLIKVAFSQYFKSNSALLDYIEGGEAINRAQILEDFIPLVEGLKGIEKDKWVYRAESEGRQRHIDRIITSMEEGILLLDENYFILLANKAGLDAFGIRRPRRPIRFTQLYRNEQMKNELNQLNQNKRATFTFVRDKQTFGVNLSVAEGGYTIIVKEVTQSIKLEKMQRDFSANVSHALKTPLTSISAFAELISKDMVRDKEKIQDYTYKIYKEAQRLQIFIDDILKLAEIQNNLPEDIRPLDIERVVYSVLDILEKNRADKNIEISVTGTASIYMRHAHLVEILANLIDNGIKYNTVDGHIKITIQENERAIEIRVTDTGIGINSDNLSEIFNRFYRVPNAEIKGNGLGLSIVETLVELYDGEICVNSGEKGTEFLLVFHK